ncbi:MAG: ABC transporter ATP-binding protein [Alphaproteobacteria bacterium]
MVAAGIDRTGQEGGLSAERVSHRFGDRLVLDGVSLAAAPGELVCLAGPSGCGKTTLLRIAAGLEDIQSGEVRAGGRIVARPGADLPAEQRGIGFVFQDYALFPHLDVASNVGFGLAAVDGARRARRIAETLAQVGMQDHARDFPHELSGGQQQRVALARALAPAPRVRLPAAPFWGLAGRRREGTRDDTLHVLKESGAATVMVTHDPEEAMFMADRLVVLDRGRVEQAGTPDEVYSRPASAFVAGFFGQANELAGTVSAGRVDTPFGPVAARGLGEGAHARVLIRPEGLRLRDAGDDPRCPAKVIASRLLGRSSWIHLCLGADGVPGQGEAHHRHFHARVPGRFLPAEGTILAVELDQAQAFVFASSGTI